MFYSFCQSQCRVWKQVNSIFNRTMSLYGVETPHVIFELQKKSSDSENDISFKELVKSKYMRMFIPKQKKDVHNKLLDCKELMNIYEKQNGSAVYSGFYKSVINGVTNYEKTVVITTNNFKLPSGNIANSFDCVEFEWKREQLYCKMAEQESVEYTVSVSDTYNPMFDCEEYRPVYHSYEDPIEALNNLSMLEGAKVLLTEIPLLMQQKPVINQLKHPFIAVEGLDGTGKSTMVRNLASYLNGVAMATPPDSIRHIRNKFDHLPELCRRSFYAFSNYLAMPDVLEVTQSKPVVMDRFWHSTAAYAIAKEAGCGEKIYLPPKNHPIYLWPSDLVRPTAVLLLTTPEKERDTRVNDRGDLTPEELEISEGQMFRRRILETYRRIGFTKWIEVDTSGTQQESLNKAVEGLRSVGICCE